MNNTPKLLLVIAGVVPLLMVAVASWVWLTIPPTPDPETLPSHSSGPTMPAYQEAVAEGRTVARSLISEEKLPGASLAVAVDGQIVWAEGFRWADMETETPVTPATLFRIGAVSQTLTATAVGRLVDAGRLDLDAPVQSYLPDFPEKEWPISTRQLMAHTAGIRPLGGEGGIFHGACADDGDRLALFADEPLRYRPGTETHFSTYGWSLVGAVITAAAGEPYLDFVQREVLEPLGMADTWPDVAGDTRAGSARFYYPRMMLEPSYGLQDAPEVDLSCHLAAVGFLSTPSDLARLGSAVMDDGFLDPATVEELRTPVRLESGVPSGQALGWTLGTIPLGADGTPTEIVGQGLGEVVRLEPLSAQTAAGQVSGGTATLLTVPEHRIAIAVVTNVTGAANVPRLAERLADIFVRHGQVR